MTLIINNLSNSIEPMFNKQYKRSANNNHVFVFGSNLSGIHGAGSAKLAHAKFGAVWGKGNGYYGNSYALPTKGYNITFMDIATVKRYVNEFIQFASNNMDKTFKVTQVGCGLAGFNKKDIASLFKNAPSNCYFDTQWKEILGNDRNYWGTF